MKLLSHSEGPTARSIPAWGNAPGKAPTKPKRAESPSYPIVPHTHSAHNNSACANSLFRQFHLCPLPLCASALDRDAGTGRAHILIAHETPPPKAHFPFSHRATTDILEPRITRRARKENPSAANCTGHSRRGAHSCRPCPLRRRRTSISASRRFREANSTPSTICRKS